MGNAALENGACRELLVDVDGVVVAGHGGEQDDVGFRDGLGERGAHPDPQICKSVTSELIHRTASWIVRKPAIHFWLLSRSAHKCLQI